MCRATADTPRSRFRCVFSSVLQNYRFLIQNNRLKIFGFDWIRTAIHNWGQKADVHPDIDIESNQIVVDESDKQERNDVTFLIDDTAHLEAALDRLGLRRRVSRMKIETLSNVSILE